jgi:hypothetical protein
MNARAPERGFTLLETLFAAGLTTAFVVSVLAAVLGSMHSSATLAERAELTDHALNILSDLREATAYGEGTATRIAGRSVVTSFPADALPGAAQLTAAIGVSPPAHDGSVVASVTVTDAHGVNVTESQTLFYEAPVPGSAIDQPGPGGGS